jgi:hypothetical protein
MFNLSKVFNKKLSGKLLGVKAPYSISFINCQMDWNEIPVLKKMATKNYPTLDNLVGVPASYGQTKSDVILRVFVNPTTEAIEKVLSAQDDDFLNSENINELLMPVLGALKLEGGAYSISKVENIFVGESKNKVLKITGKTENGLKATSYSENVFVCTPSFLLIFNLLLTDMDEPKIDIIKSDFSKILDSIKL